jgi:hypothetical protein
MKTNRFGAQLKRAHSAEPDTSGATSAAIAKAEGTDSSDEGPAVPPPWTFGDARSGPGPSSQSLSKSLPESAAVGSPMKKHRPSINFPSDGIPSTLSSGVTTNVDDILARAAVADAPGIQQSGAKADQDEEL